MTVRVRRPPRVSGAPAPRAADVLRLVWWAQRGYVHGVRAGRGAGRVFSVVLAVAWWPAAPLLVPVQAGLMVRRRARYYMTLERDAVLAVVATGQGWRVEDHASGRPGTGRGRALRARVLPELVAAADVAGITIYTTAATAPLAAAYAQEVPGLVDAGRGFPRGRRLRRAPTPDPAQDTVTEAEVEALVRQIAHREGFAAPQVRWTEAAQAVTRYRGRVVVLRRSMLRDTAEARFVALHELGHVALGHQRPRQTLATTAALLIALLTPALAAIPIAARTGAPLLLGLWVGALLGLVLLAIGLRLLVHPREHEADAWAARRGGVLTEQLARTAYGRHHPRLQAFEAVLSTHPPLTARIAHVRTALAQEAP